MDMADDARLPADIDAQPVAASRRFVAADTARVP